MAYTGDEGIKRKFFRDLERLFSQKPQLDRLLRSSLNLGLKSNQGITFPCDSKNLGFAGDEAFRIHSLDYPYLHYVAPMCKFGPMCMFNHPVSPKISDDQDKSKLPHEIPCKFYPAGLCKYGESCRFNHSKSEAEKSPLQLNILGFPKRLGKMNCPFYMRTGMCDYGASCKFHHPDPLMVSDTESMNNHKEGLETTQPCLLLPLLRTNNFPSMHQICVLNGYQASNYKQKVEIAGDYASKREPCVLNDVGLPIRPGKKVCWVYEHLDICSFGRACAYDHPKKHSSTYGSTSASPSGVKPQERGTLQK